MAQDVWLEMINSAQSTLDLEQFYVSNQAGEELEPVLQAISAAAQRGVKVRLIVDKKFYGTYPDSVNQIAQTINSEARTIDFSTSAAFSTPNISSSTASKHSWAARTSIGEP